MKIWHSVGLVVLSVVAVMVGIHFLPKYFGQGTVFAPKV